MSSASVVLLYNRSNSYGLAKDAKILEESLRAAGVYTIQHCDPLEPPQPVDIVFHLEQPSYVWMGWSRVNILVVNPEWYVPESYNAYMSKFDLVIFKNQSAKARFSGYLPEVKSLLLPWALGSWTVEGVTPKETDARIGFACFLGASKNRHAFFKKLLPFWRSTYPTLQVFSLFEVDVPEAENIKVRVGDLDETQRYKMATFFPGHIVCSDSEGYSYTAAEAEAVGAYSIHNAIEAFLNTYSGEIGVGWMEHTQLASDPTHSYGLFSKIGEPEITQASLDRAIKNFMDADLSEVRKVRKERAIQRREAFNKEVASLVGTFSSMLSAKKKFARPPILLPENCPPISIVTLLYGRKQFFDLACHNIMISDYPKDKIEWILVDDSEEKDSEKILKVAAAADPLKMVYVELGKKTPISEKRNIGVSKATNQIILMMDDDDHYPETSFRRRVAWLTLHPWTPQAVGCTTLACYDLVAAISSVNVPPFDIPLGQRISEATLTFYKSWWEERSFATDIQIGEGEGFIRGRESQFLELPPQQIIVAFSHGQNTSSRRVPKEADVKPGCFWGFPREFLIFLHGLAGIKVKEEV